MATTYWVETTEADHLREVYEASRPVAAILMLDNYEDLMKACEDTQRSAVLAQIDEKLQTWANAGQGILLKTDRHHYLFLFEEQYFQHFVDEKFSILDTVRAIRVAENIHPTLSIGCLLYTSFHDLAVPDDEVELVDDVAAVHQRHGGIDHTVDAGFQRGSENLLRRHIGHEFHPVFHHGVAGGPEMVLRQLDGEVSAQRIGVVQVFEVVLVQQLFPAAQGVQMLNEYHFKYLHYRCV